MPSTYAHFRFGREVLRQLPPQLRDKIISRIQLYHIGLHGPDIFFYYQPFSQNPVRKLGEELHAFSGQEIFKQMEETRNTFSEDNRAGLDAYLYGFICHYALDSTAHGTVYQGIKETGVNHTAIETEFDRALMERDGLEPHRQPLVGHIIPSLPNAAVISRFFPTVTAKQVEKSLQSMRFFHWLLLAPGTAKRKTLLFGLRATGKYDSLNGMIIRPEGNPACAAVTEALFERYREAVPLAVELIENAFTPQWLSDERMKRNFESEKVSDCKK